MIRTPKRQTALAVFLVLALSSCSDSSQESIFQTGRSFPPGFLFGVGYSAYQVEGNSTNNDWDVWNQEGHGKDLNGLASNSYVLYDQDARLAKEAGARAFRTGI